MNEQAGAQHVVSRLMRESLMDKTLIAGTESPVRAILPNLNVIQIGGSSIMDRGLWSLNRLCSDRPRRLIGVLAFKLPCGRCQL